MDAMGPWGPTGQVSPLEEVSVCYSRDRELLHLGTLRGVPGAVTASPPL